MAIIHHIQLDSESRQLSISHSPCHSEVFYDICNEYGHIILHGYLNHTGNSIADVSQLHDGRYCLQIILEGELFRKKININHSLRAQIA